ncbi:UTP--glucose-1-phosphate uridylyltransferase GalU [Alcaligenes ammonioxydans]|jgi:UTP--glucose-1-phosphate uridylyltransferase|uniref:UTP--glucose-1-phosphate uridylyltransferase n=1 Tax=Alcaligenes ammonioxydans TaxID=2582914 RepID=A0ABX8SQ12_9BURK|nr:UTP--glucose-1-phosphate uridylyltransferase GalU [Alcaligenes ammonioxydans]EJC61362.1 UTP-glucose-1-phosphate uridylyltransferase [Alcaligenes faecalis subsp. faecalis NCIB 8687]QBH19751.1 UTP--glucose-1-phosphate uridylyltransferase GalU [Alcaligenes faecalis]MCH1880184.1 UTP--glucose-1-phosphate uridylyltransferase GalU [Alcaligenes ammonioxydans]QXX77759.1 UTP--glucose-1-phosphate uridylyltransferase GalU [Alcaligenes ammonioxydans]WGQ35805.1 UTP--glucose-1-phosphate uridylyltransferas
MKPIRKAVFPVAGLGTRFLPATKAMPKEMLPIVDKPLIQYAVEEAIAAGVTELIFITGRNKRAIEDHFDSIPELEQELAGKNKLELLDAVQNIIPSHVSCIYTRQPRALGLGHAVLCAAPIVGNEPFLVLLADDLIDANTPVSRQLVEAAHQYNGSIVATQNVNKNETNKYGIVSGDLIDSKATRLNGIVEKPAPEVAPSTQAVVGRYVLEPEIFDHLRRTQAGVGGEIQLTDGIASLLKSRAVYAYEYEGTRYDCGSKSGFFHATLEFGRKYHGL